MREVLTVIPFTPITINPNSTSLPLLPSQYNLTDYIPVSMLNLGISGRVRSMGKETKDGKRRWRKAEGEMPEGAVSSVSGVSGSGNPTDRSTRGLPVLPHPPESTQTHVHWVGDAIRPSHPCRPLLCLPSGEQRALLTGSCHLLGGGFPGGSVVKNSACQCRRRGLTPWVRNTRWRRKWQVTSVFLPGKSHRQRSLAGYSPLGREESERTQQINNNKKYLNFNDAQMMWTTWNW